MPTNLFLVVEYPALEIPLIAFTAQHPGTTIDVISEPSVEEAGHWFRPSLVMIQGATAAQLDGILAASGQVYDQVKTLERNDAARLWMGRMRVSQSNVYKLSPASAILGQFQHRFGIPWVHVEEGDLHLRARVNDPAGGEALADQVTRYFAREKVQAQVDLHEISSRDYSVWQKLVEHSIGMAS